MNLAEIKYFEVIKKALSNVEVPVKQKYLRTIIMGTFLEKGSEEFWTTVYGYPQLPNKMVFWKLCYIVHTILREGHPLCVVHSYSRKSTFENIVKKWSESSNEEYGEMVFLYSNLIRSKLEFHNRNPEFPGDLSASFDELESFTERKTTNYFQLFLSTFDYLESLLLFQEAVFKSMKIQFSTNTCKCKMAPLITCVQDSSKLYDHCVKILFILHSQLPISSLTEHREKFAKQFNKLKIFYLNIGILQEFNGIVDIPNLPEKCPNFLIEANLPPHITSTIKESATFVKPSIHNGVGCKANLSASYNFFSNSADGLPQPLTPLRLVSQSSTLKQSENKTVSENVFSCHISTIHGVTIYSHQFPPLSPSLLKPNNAFFDSQHNLAYQHPRRLLSQTSVNMQTNKTSNFENLISLGSRSGGDNSKKTEPNFYQNTNISTQTPIFPDSLKTDRLLNLEDDLIQPSLHFRQTSKSVLSSLPTSFNNTLQYPTSKMATPTNGSYKYTMPNISQQILPGSSSVIPNSGQTQIDEILLPLKPNVTPDERLSNSSKYLNLQLSSPALSNHSQSNFINTNYRSREAPSSSFSNFIPVFPLSTTIANTNFQNSVSTSLDLSNFSMHPKSPFPNTQASPILSPRNFVNPNLQNSNQSNVADIFQPSAPPMTLETNGEVQMESIVNRDHTIQYLQHQLNKFKDSTHSSEQIKLQQFQEQISALETSLVIKENELLKEKLAKADLLNRVRQDQNSEQRLEENKARNLQLRYTDLPQQKLVDVKIDDDFQEHINIEEKNNTSELDEEIADVQAQINFHQSSKDLAAWRNNSELFNIKAEILQMNLENLIKKKQPCGMEEEKEKKKHKLREKRNKIPMVLFLGKTAKK